MEWTTEAMDKVIKSLSEKLDEYDMGDQHLYEVRFEDDGDIALVHRSMNQEGKWQFMVTWMHTQWATEITEDMLDDWNYNGEEPWWAFTEEYEQDKAEMERRGGIYRLV